MSTKTNNIEDIYPLSPTQRGILFHTLASPGSGVYVTQFGCTLYNGPNIAALREAWRQVIARHPILRTAFDWEQRREPLQIVLRDITLSWFEQDWRDLSESKQDQRLLKLRDEDRRRGFALDEAPLMRIAVFRLTDTTYHLLWTTHHLVLDGWSTSRVLRECFGVYQSLCNGGDLKLETPRPFRDYISWLKRQDLSLAERYWRRELSGFYEATPLTIGRTERKGQSGAHQSAEAELSKELTASLERLARKNLLTMNTVVGGAWALLLSRYAGLNDVVFGINVSGRPADLPGAETIVGLFVNTLPLRARINTNATVLDFLAELQQQQLEMSQYGYSPLAEVQRWSEIDAGDSLLESIFVFENYPMKDALSEAGALTLNETSDGMGGQAERQRRSVSLGGIQSVEQSSYQLTLAAIPGPALTLVCSYDSERFEAAEINRMLGHIQSLLVGMAADPQQHVSSLELLTDSEKQQLVVDWNQTENLEAAKALCIHELFERRADLSSDSIAVASGSSFLTYGELNDRADQLASYLKFSGVGAETPVGVCLKRSPNMLVAILGVLKAGGAYVPLDISLPNASLRFIMDDTEMALVITQDELAGELPSHWAQVFCIDSDWDRVAQHDGEFIGERTTPQNIAYIIYTSGSTGRPKGVLVEHRGIPNLARSQIEAFDVKAESRVLQFASLSFDASVSEIFITLTAGATLWVEDEESLLPSKEFAARLRDSGISVVTLPPSFLSVLPADDLSGLATIVSAGEACPAEVVERWAPGRNFINAYGPTECTVCATMAELSESSGAPVIGRPIPNVKAYILDSNGHHTPVGVPGELNISGLGLARGYINRPELTAEKFVPDPFSLVPGGRLYNTGDRARFLPDGNLVFMGRADNQVKLRGYRIELEEISATLDRHHEVMESAVVVREDVPGDKRLVAYVVPRTPSTLGKEATKSDDKPLELWPSVAEYFVYDDLIYYALTYDEKRNEKYKAALERVVAGKAVVDIGTGPEAILARLCVEAGARKVYAIELLEETYKKAQAVVMRLQLEDRISLIQGDSRRVELPEQVDVCVSEIVGPISGVEGAAPILNDAQRFLNEDGVFVPDRCTTHIAATEVADELLRGRGFSEQSAEYVRKIFVDVGYQFDLRLCLKNFPASRIISDSAVFEDLEFSRPIDLEHKHDITLRINRRATMDGFVLWLCLQTIAGVVINTLEQEFSWLPVYFPVFYPPIEVSEGDLITAVCSRTHEGNGTNPDYRIRGAVVRQSGDPVAFDYESFHSKRRHKATPFYRELFSKGLPDVLPRNEENLTQELRTYLRERLPHYMNPSSIVTLNRLPLNTSGKLDRKALPAPAAEQGLAPESSHIQSRMEEIVAAFWCEVLRRPRVGRLDNFLDLGGHSLLAVQLIGRVNNAFRVEVPLRGFFDEPTVKGLASMVSRELEAKSGLQAPEISRRVHDDDVPLSFGQQRMWLLDQLTQGTNAYNIPSVTRLSGNLDIDALRRSFNEIVKRHESLRTIFKSVDGQPRAEIVPAGDIDLTIFDLSDMAPDETETQSRLIVAQETQKSFDLASGPLLRACLLRWGPDEHLLVLTMHHIVSDAWSVGIFHREMAALYEAFSTDVEVVLPEPPIQYPDFAAWQREWFQGENLEHHFDYWRTQLGGSLPLLELPSDRPRSAVQSFAGAAESISLSDNLLARLRQLSSREGATMFMAITAAFAVLLHRLTGQDDIIIGTPVVNRNRPETEGLIGFFVNTLALRVDLSGDPSFLDLLSRVREVCIDAYTHQDLPFERLVEVLQPARDTSRNPIFQAMLAFQSIGEAEIDLQSLTVAPLPFESRVAKFDLTFFVVETPNGMTAAFEYCTDLFEPETARRWVRYLENLLNEIAKDPSVPITQLRMLEEAERQQLLVDWNDTAIDYHWQSCIHSRFEEQSVKVPDRSALIWGLERVTYRELNRRANQLSHFLIARGACPETLIPILLGRSPALVVAMLAVLKAGAAFVALDPLYPLSRLSFILEDIAATMVITDSGLLESVSPVSADAVCIDELGTLIAMEPECNPRSGVESSNLAYLIYTSGSTGRPKGVATEHRDLGTLIEWAGRNFTARELEMVLGSTSICFDMSMFEIFMTLSQGGTVVLVENALGLANAEARRSVTLIHTVPSAMTELLRQEAVPPSVCTVNLAGEVLSPKLIKNAYRQAPDIERVLNLFGPTENAQYTTLEKISRTAEDVYIGKPLENTRLYILDHALEPVGRGVIGELCIASTGLARGYHKRPELTAERFIPGEFGNESGSRIYRTGDLCRYLPDGRLEYRGRADRQIKLRGFRIELGEVEEAIRALPGVGAAAVVVAEGPAGEKHLVAYVEQAANLPADGQVIKSSLREKLPGYMVPSQITLMDALPLTPNGKIDRAALPTTFSGSGGSDYVAPSTAAESKLYEIWREVLGIEKIGVDDNFFDLGGHSLLATQVVSRIQRSFNQQMPLQTFFQRPTIRSIAEIIADGADERKAPSAIVALPRGKRSLEELLAEVNQIPDPEIRDAEPVAEKAEGGIAS